MTKKEKTGKKKNKKNFMLFMCFMVNFCVAVNGYEKKKNMGGTPTLRMAAHATIPRR